LFISNSCLAFNPVNRLYAENENENKNELNINTIIFIDKNDEMVSARILRERIDQYELTNWRIYEVTNAGAAIRPRYHHLLIDSRCVSASTWQYISGTITDFLD
jgi:hypothetical protein